MNYVTGQGLNALAAEIRRIAVDHGFWESDRNFGEMIALQHSELSEALESHRDGEYAYWLKHADDCIVNPCSCTPKPEGWAVEEIDAVIRILDTLHGQVDIDAILVAKMKYNRSRPYKHGKGY